MTRRCATRPRVTSRDLHWLGRSPLLSERQVLDAVASRASGVRGLLIYCADSIAISGDRWPDDARLSDIEARWT